MTRNTQHVRCEVLQALITKTMILLLLFICYLQLGGHLVAGVGYTLYM